MPEGKKIQGEEELNELLSKHFDIDLAGVNKLPRRSLEACLPLLTKIMGLLK